MKTKLNRKIITAALAATMGCGLVGSIAGTVAWYQFSTRSQAEMLGVTAGVNRNLEIKVGEGDWKKDLSIADIQAYLHGIDAKYGDEIHPITSGELSKDASALPSFKERPAYQMPEYSKWADVSEDSLDIVKIPLSIRAVEYTADDQSDATFPSKEIRLRNLTIKEAAADTKDGDISPALRVMLKTANAGKVFAKGAADLEGDVTTAVGGKLDLNGDGALDHGEGYSWDETEELVYGDASKNQVAYNLAKQTTGEGEMFVDDEGNNFKGGLSIGTSSSAAGVSCEMIIWLEGWHQLDDAATSTKSAMWNAEDYVGTQFNVGIRFSSEK